MIYLIRMMLYLVRTLKEQEKHRISTDFILQAQDETTVKSFFNRHKIIILGVSPVAGWPNSAEFFWEFQLTEEEKSIFCLKSENLETFVQRCIELWLPLLRVTNRSKTVTAEQSLELIARMRAQYEEHKQEEKKQQQAEQEKKNKLIDDKKKEKFMSVIEETLQDIVKLEQLHKDNLAIATERRKLLELKDQLIKIKMGSNVEKWIVLLEEVFGLMEKIEMQSMYKLKEQEQKIASNSVVSNVDIVSELEKLKRAQQTNQIGAKKTSSDLYYTYLGVVGLYQKFIAKDILNKIFHGQVLTVNFKPYLSFITLISALWSGIFFSYYAIVSSIHYTILFMMIVTGILALVWLIVSLAPMKKLSHYFLYVILAIIATIVIYKMMVIFLVLV